MSSNENQLQVEVLQPEITGQIQRASAEELKNWIKDGKLKPHHQIRIKNLSWVEAKNIPAFKSLFELSEANEESKLDLKLNESVLNAFKYEKIKFKPDEEFLRSRGKNESGENESEADETDFKDKPKSSEPSLAFKLFEKKAAAKSKRKESATVPDAAEAELSESDAEQKPLKKSKGSRFVKKTAGFLIGVALMFLLGYGGSYLWIYQLKTPAQIDEKNLPELALLSDKLTSDKLELRLKTAEKEREFKNGNSAEQPAKPAEINQQIAKLDKQFNDQRKNIVEAHKNKLQTADFKTTFYFSFAVLLCVFMLVRVVYDRKTETDAGRDWSKKTVIETEDDSDVTEIVDNETADQALPKTELHKAKSQTIETFEPKAPAKSARCLLHTRKASDFVCRECDNYFCEECTVTIDENVNCCPFCKVTCLPVIVKQAEARDDRSE